MLNNNKRVLHFVGKEYQKNSVNKLAFTLTEVIIATFISTIVLGFIFVFLSNISTGIIQTKKEVGIMSSFYDFTYKLNNYRNIYTSGSILINNSGTGSDVFLMRDIKGENGILFGAINLDDYKLDSDTTIYEDRAVGFRKMSATELAEVDGDVNLAYNYIFQEDKIFKDLKVTDFILISYNSGSIFDLSLIVNLDFQNSLVGQSWADLPIDNFKKFNIDF